MLRATRLTGGLLLFGSQAARAVSLSSNDTTIACGSAGCSPTVLVSSTSTQILPSDLSSTAGTTNTSVLATDASSAVASSTSLLDVSSSSSVVLPATANTSLPVGPSSNAFSTPSTPSSSTENPITTNPTSQIVSVSTTLSPTDAGSTTQSDVPTATSAIRSITSSASVISLSDGLTATAQGSDVVIANSTISVGGPAFTGNSITVSLASSGIVNVDGATTTFQPASTTPSSTENAVTSVASVTATMTTLPSGVSTQGITISGVSTNTWYTTTNNGQPTILPVIWCPSCGSGESILIWNLPSSLTDIEFDWTSVFPDLPKISFPCIKVFGVTVGDCPAAETEGSDDDDDDDSSSSSDSGSSTSKTDPSSSSSESCSSSTVSDCKVGCSISTISASSTTTVCYTTSCYSTVGCSLQPSTSTTVSTSSGIQKTLTQSRTPYNIAATWSSLGVETPEWYLGATLAWPASDDDTGPVTATGDDSEFSTSQSGVTTATSEAVNSTTADVSTTLASTSSTGGSVPSTTVASSTSDNGQSSNSTALASSTADSAASTTVASSTSNNAHSTTSSASASETSYWCHVYGDSSGTYYCQCGDGADLVTSPIVSGSCPYTSHAVTSTASATPTPAPAGTTTTTYWNSVVQECTSYSKLNVGVDASACIGPTIYSPTTSAAQPTASCDTEFTSSLDKLFQIYGVGWDEGILGNGDAFRDALASCGGDDVSDWDFEAPPGDGTDWDFLATGEMKGVGGCYEQAAIDAGGCLVGGSKTMPSSSS